MDRVIEKKNKFGWKKISVVAGSLVATFALYQVVVEASVSTYKVDAEQIIVSQVNVGTFEDIIPIRGTIEPSNSVFLDSVAGGVVDDIFIENGSMVEKGQPILQLQNADLHLNVTRNNTSITEQLNNLSNIANNLETKKLQTEREVLDINYRIKTLERDKKRFEELIDNQLLSEQQYLQTVDEIQYQRKVLDNTFARQQLEEKIRDERLAQIAQQIEKLEKNLNISTKSLDNLLVRAPISGQLTSFAVEIGESKTVGERLGQIDDKGNNNIVAQIDEYYVSRVQIGQPATFNLAGKSFQATVENIYPEISSGTFEVDLKFAEEMPENIRRGQTLHLELLLGNRSESLLLAKGGFLQETGGNWVFVVNQAGDEAIRRNIRLGRRNNLVVEVLEGLQSGDRVITSGYSSMQNVERVKLIN